MPARPGPAPAALAAPARGRAPRHRPSASPSLPAPTSTLLDLFFALDGGGALWLAPLLGGLHLSHRPLLDRFGWRRGGWLLLVGVPLGLAAAVWGPFAASLPVWSMAAW